MPPTPNRNHLTRDKIASLYLDQLPFAPYPVQEEALLTYFTADQGVLVCAPTGTGKTLIAEAALFEALHTGTRAYYTTPLIALTEQKLEEMQAAAVRWGFSADQIGLVTGHRRVNPDAPVLVVVAEILFNRLLHSTSQNSKNQRTEEPNSDLRFFGSLDFTRVSAVVMDEFHNFADPERGIVWEFALGLLPPHIRLLLLSATVGNAFEFTQWLRHSHGRSIELVQSTDRKVPLEYRWVGDMLLTELLEHMAANTTHHSPLTTHPPSDFRYTPSLVFCFNRDECWNVAETLKGKALLADGQQKRIADELTHHDWSEGAGPKLRALLQRGVGVHHAGILPKYRRVIEDLFQKKLLSVCVCTETLAAGINLPARSVVLPTILKGKPGEMKVIDASTAHQIFGRAGRPQFDKQGYVFALAHEDDVKILRAKEKLNQIPENTKDPGLLRMRKDLQRKVPTRRSTEQYWTEQQWQKLLTAPPLRLASRGPIPWRLLAYMLDTSPEIEPIRRLVSKRLLDSTRLAGANKQLDQMLMALWAGGYVTLDPPPPAKEERESGGAGEREQEVPRKKLLDVTIRPADSPSRPLTPSPPPNSPPSYHPKLAHPTEDLKKLLKLRGINPLYGIYLVNQLGIASREERIQAFESVLEMPGSVARHVRVPKYEDMPPGPLATTRLDIELLQMGLATPEQLGAKPAQEDDEPPRGREMFAEKVWPLTLAEKLRLLFDASFPSVHSLFTTPVWAAGEVLEFGGNFNKYITSRGLQKQEGVIFRHLLRLILLLKEFQQFTPPDCSPVGQTFLSADSSFPGSSLGTHSPEAPASDTPQSASPASSSDSSFFLRPSSLAAASSWLSDLREISAALTDCCHRVDPQSTDKALEEDQDL
jgi:superfamily II DNA/RNA helicase